MEQPEFESVQEVFVDSLDGDRVPFKIGFYRSKNLHTLNIKMHNTNIGDVGLKDYTDISVEIISPDGFVEYSEDEAQIKARGNSTYGMEKRAFEIKLSGDVSFMGMTKSDKWVLLANARDNTKMCNKMVFDTAAAIGMEYVTESDWADVYIDGIYWGNYLLCHEPDIGKDDLDIKNLQKDNAPFYNPGRCYEDNEMKGYYYDQNPADISGGYLLSIDPNSDRAKAGFYLDKNIFFRIKSPRNASKEEVEYIRDFMLKVGQEIDGGNNDEDSDIAYIDPKSFAKRYLIE